MKHLKRIKFVLIPLLLWMFAHMIYTVVDGVRDEGKSVDIAIILGNKVNPDGNLSERLLKRVECGLDIYQAKRVKLIMVSGGLGKEGHYEGDKMKEFLIKKGVPENVIVVDNAGVNTRATVENAMNVRDSLKFNSVLVVSQYFHLTRTKMLFRKKGLKEVSSVSPEYFEFRDIYSLLRECIAYYTQ